MAAATVGSITICRPLAVDSPLGASAGFALAAFEGEVSSVAACNVAFRVFLNCSIPA